MTDEDKVKKTVYAVAKWFGFSVATVFSSGEIGMRGYGKLECDAMFVVKRAGKPYMPIYADTRFFSWRDVLEKIAGCRLTYSITGGKDCFAVSMQPRKNYIFESAGVEDLIIKLELEGIKL